MRSLQEDVRLIEQDVVRSVSYRNGDGVRTEIDPHGQSLTIALEDSSRLKSVPGMMTITVGVMPWEVIGVNDMCIWTRPLGHVTSAKRYELLNVIGRKLNGWTYQYGVKLCIDAEGNLYAGCHDVVPDERPRNNGYANRIWDFCSILDECWPRLQPYLE